MKDIFTNLYKVLPGFFVASTAIIFCKGLPLTAIFSYYFEPRDWLVLSAKIKQPIVTVFRFTISCLSSSACVPEMNNSIPSYRLVACLLNISEARNKAIVESVANAAINFPSKSKNLKCSSAVLNIFSDYDYNRSVITIAAPVENIEESVFRACQVAYREIDLERHTGGHPRLGSVDLIPIHTITTSVSLADCGNIALSLGQRLVSNIKGTSVFLFGHADQPLVRGLVERRKAVNWYHGRHGMDFSTVGWDLGTAPSQRYGCTGVGAIPYVTNCNVTIDSQDLGLGKEIASAIRASTPGGLAGVQSMGFKHEGRVEIACNVEASKVLFT